MPQTEVVFFREEDGSTPALDWLAGLEPKAFAKCFVKIERLGAEGNALRRPEADSLRDGIYELRVSLRGINYRVLYFFAGERRAVISHGLTKERRVPPADIDRAVRNKRAFLANPKRHTHSPRE